MGVRCEVTVVGETSAVIAQQCLHRIAQYELLWSRFIPTSDISRLNAAHGEPVWVDAQTTQLVAYMLAAHAETNGHFNPTLLPLQILAGDSRSLVDEKVTVLNDDATAHNTMDSVRILEDGRVQLLNDASLDAGGIAKGFTADLVMEDALRCGATGACINIGGDMAIHTGSEEAWPVHVMSPIHKDKTVDTVLISHGAVATSAVNARHRDGSNVVNHIFTPHGASTTRTMGATVVASHAAWAEAYTKYALIAPPHEALQAISDKGLAALLVLNDDTILSTNSWKELAQ